MTVADCRIVKVPGSKSIANRALVCAALANSESKIVNCAPGDDTEVLINCLQSLGVAIAVTSGVVEVGGKFDRTSTHEVFLDSHLAGTSSRFLTALAGLREGPTIIDGQPTLRGRPMIQLHEALIELGADVSWRANRGELPVVVSQGIWRKSRIEMLGSTSSQFISALMLIAPYFSTGLTIDLVGPIVSRGYLEMTADVMRKFGAQVDFAGESIEIASGQYCGTEFVVEPDASSASYPAGAVAIRGGSTIISGLSITTTQGDVEFLHALEKMGCEVTQTSSGIRVSRGATTTLKGIEIDMSQISDCVPTLVGVALFANSPTTITGVEFIRHKESDRIGDLAFELTKIGAKIDQHIDGMTITPSKLHSAKLSTHHDHRLAMVFGLLRLLVTGIEIENQEVVIKSWPNYFTDIDSF